MIISASRRTDIPAYYTEWFFRRLEAEEVLVRNPMNYHAVSRISLSRKVLDGIVLWTKDPRPLFRYLDKLEQYPFYIQFTLTAYGADVERNLPPKGKVLVPVFQKLSQEIGKERVVWRYDPILFNEKYTMQYHIKYFRLLAERLALYTEKCTVSFLTLYQKTARNIRPLAVELPSAAQKAELLGAMAETAAQCGIIIDTCAQPGLPDVPGVQKASCIDRIRLERLCGYPLELKADNNQREGCGCVQSIDIGAYHTCKNGCLYCYANTSPAAASKNFALHNPGSPLLLGELLPGDTIKDRPVHSARTAQPRLFDC